MTRLRWAACPLVLLLPIAACGDDDDPASATTTAETAPTTASDDGPALTEEDVAGFEIREATFGNLTYVLTSAHVTNQDLRTYADQSEPEPTDATHLILDVEVENPTSRQIESDPDAIRLELDGDEIGVADDFLTDATGFVPANETIDGFLAFEIDATADASTAELVFGATPDRPSRLPLSGTVPGSTLPMELDVAGSADGTGPTNGGVLTFELLGATLDDDLPHGDTTSPTGERADMGEIFVQLHLRVTKVEGRGNDLLTDDAFKLLVDGVARAPFDSATAPEGSTSTPTAEPDASVDAWVLFAVEAGAGSYVLQVGDADEGPGTITIEIPAV